MRILCVLTIELIISVLYNITNTIFIVLKCYKMVIFKDLRRALYEKSY